MGWAPRRLRDRTLLSYVPALLLTVVAAVIAARAFGSALRYSEEVLESTQLLVEGNELRGSIASAQSAVRGFAITGREEYLVPYHYADRELQHERVVAGTTWAARPMQRAQVARALDLFFQWKDEVAEPAIHARRPSEAETMTLFLRGRPILERAHQLLGEVVESERRLLQVRSHRNESAARRGRLIVIAAPLVALLYILAASYLMTRQTVRAVESVSRAAMGLSAGDLSQRVRPAATDEIGSLAHAFNAMAERLALRTSETALLAELVEMLQVAVTEREVGELFERFTRRLLSVSGARLYLYDAGRRQFRPALGWGPPGPESFPASACWGVRLGKPYYSVGRDGPPCEHIGDLAGLGSLCLPMVVQTETLGLIQYLYETDAPDETNARDEAVLRMGMEIAERCAFTLSNLRLRQRLREQSIRDPLTGLLNRRYLEEAFEREIERARRLDRPLGVLMIDIDHFKRVNDAAGHAAGDALLRAFGGLLDSAFRAGDEAYRYGGEEFLVVMPDAAQPDVVERARTLQSRIARLHVVFDGGTVPPITVSIGVSAFPRDGDSPAELIRAADDALYRAKQAGRDRIVAARVEGDGARDGAAPEPPRESP